MTKKGNDSSVLRRSVQGNGNTYRNCSGYYTRAAPLPSTFDNDELVHLNISDVSTKSRLRYQKK